MSNETSINIKDFIFNFTNEFSDSFLYAYILQIILISYMYSCVGTGRYWKIMLGGSLFGMYAAITEHIGTAWLKTIEESEGSIKGSKGLYCYMFAELGWIATEFSIPYLNLIKLNTLSQSKIIKSINHTIVLLFFFFAGFRLYIGYLRLTHEVLYDEAIYSAHGVTFGIVAVTNGLLSIFIFIHLNKSTEISKEEDRDGETFTVLKLFKKSSLFILFVVDLVSFILATLSVFSGISSLRDPFSKLIKPFHALKSNFILVLAIDAFIFKMRTSIEGTNIISRFQKRQSKSPSNVGGDNDSHSNKRIKNKNSPMPSMTNSITTSLSALTTTTSNTPTYSTLKKHKSFVKKNYEESESPSHRINMESIDIGTVNGMTVDVYGVEKHEVDKKYGIEKNGKGKNESYSGNEKYGNEKYGNEKYGNEKYGNEKYGNGGTEKYGNARNEKHYGAERYVNERRYSSSSSTFSNVSQYNLKKKKVYRSSQINIPLPQNPLIVKPIKSLSPSYNNNSKASSSNNGSPYFSNINVIQNSLTNNENQINSNKDDNYFTVI